MTDWLPPLSSTDRPLYRAILDALRRDIVSGRLKTGDRLPAQRQLAERLSIDFTTVSRAYNQARALGLIEAHVGRGTFVAGRGMQMSGTGSRRAIDMSMNQPPPIADNGLATQLRGMMAQCLTANTVELLQAYRGAGGTEADRILGCHWLERRSLTVPPDRLLVAPGAQAALLASLSTLAREGDTLLCDALTYPGFRAAAAQLRLKVCGLATDANGILPQALDTACQSLGARVLYLCPTLNNPTTLTMSGDRRAEIAGIVRRHDLLLLEDDAYGALDPDAPPPLAARVPDRTIYIGGLAKCLSPALRMAYMVAPDAGLSSRLAGALRACSGMTCPLSTAVMRGWSEAGLAEAALAAIRAETANRQSIARALLPQNLLMTDPSAFHAWLTLPGAWTRGEFLLHLRARDIGAVASDAFSTGPAPEAIRLGLGAPESADDLTRSLTAVADLLAQPPALAGGIV
ncbi:transcriptional regulator [Roseibium aquae]|uniref:Transcriptional regulator n=1 Tax=Roseibium aquae TaxID=1323746 RepID=A0A916TMQ8_9HYPH|nr:PLP-dependent aminotransferase family protein [Roseibium aquae]GGB49958.1 transcriptional regulator [Roseibium aquae]